MIELFYKFTSIHLNQFAVLSDSAVGDSPKNISNELNFSFDTRSNQLFCQFGVLLEGSNNAPLVKAELLCGFTIREDTVSALTTNNSVTFPIEMVGHIASLTYSALRGILFIKLEGTPLSGLVLPLQNIYPNITRPFIVDLNSQ